MSAVQNPTEFLEQKDEVKDKPTPFKIIAALCFLAVIIGSFVKVRSKSREYIREGIYYGLPLILLTLSLLSPQREFFANLGEFSVNIAFSIATPSVQDIDPYIFLSRLSEIKK